MPASSYPSYDCGQLGAQNRLTVLTSLTLDCYANPEAARGSADVSFVPISGDELPPQIAPV